MRLAQCFQHFLQLIKAISSNWVGQAQPDQTIHRHPSYMLSIILDVIFMPTICSVCLPPYVFTHHFQNKHEETEGNQNKHGEHIRHYLILKDDDDYDNHRQLVTNLHFTNHNRHFTTATQTCLYLEDCFFVPCLLHSLMTFPCYFSFFVLGSNLVFSLATPMLISFQYTWPYYLIFFYSVLSITVTFFFTPRITY